MPQVSGVLFKMSLLPGLLLLCSRSSSVNQAFSRVSGRKARYLGLGPMFQLELGTFSLEPRDQRRCRWNLMSFDVDFNPWKPLWSHWTVTLGLGEAVHPVQLEVRRFGFDFQPCASQSATHFQVTSLRRVTFCLCFSISAQGLLLGMKAHWETIPFPARCLVCGVYLSIWTFIHLCFWMNSVTSPRN